MLPNPWDTLPSYWTTLVDAVSVINSDFNGDGVVNAADYSVWRDSLGQTGVSLAADADGDGVVTNADYAIWKSNFGAISVVGPGAAASSAIAVPEPTGITMMVVASVFFAWQMARLQVLSPSK